MQEDRPWPHVPEDAYAARGHWGQSLTVIPSKDLVVVRTADDRDGSFSLDTFLRLALAVATVEVDYEERSVRTAAVLLWGEKARFVSERDGCILE